MSKFLKVSYWKKTIKRFVNPTIRLSEKRQNMDRIRGYRPSGKRKHRKK